MGILRYIVQGFGWEVGRTAARGAIDELKEREADPDPPPPPAPSPREQKKLEAAHRKEAARKQAEIEAELRRLKKQR